jgi:flagellar biosynthesis protein FliR
MFNETSIDHGDLNGHDGWINQYMDEMSVFFVGFPWDIIGNIGCLQYFNVCFLWNYRIAMGF